MSDLKTTLLVLIILLSGGTVKTQNIETDSLKALLNLDIADSTYIQTALDIAWNYMYSESDSTEIYAKKALERSENTNRRLSIANANNTLGVCFLVKADYYVALSYLSKALETGNQLLEEDPNNKKYKRRVLAIYTNIGNIHYYKANYAKSIDNYIKALKLSEEIGFENGIAICSSNIASAYKDLINYPKALEYNYKALAIAKKTGDRFALVQSLNNLGSVYFSIPDYDSAYSFFFKSIKINKSSNDEYELINNYVNMADVLRETGKYDSALYYYNLSISISKKLNSIDGLINCNFMIGQLYKKTNKLDKSSKYFKECLKLAEESGTLRFIMLANEQLAEIYQEKGDYRSAFNYFKESKKTSDTIFNAESEDRVADIEAKYRTEKKEEEIEFLREKTALQHERSKTNKTIFSAVIVILVLIIVIVIMSYRSNRHKQLAEKIKIQQNAERNILNAVVETEYKERKRFAEDLHDGLGVLLSTTRLYINEIDENITVEERKNLIAQSNSMLDDAIANARNISNNIMPASLKKNGLEMAIKSFSDKINSSGNIFIEVNSINFKKHYKNTLEISLYRILTEMINNTLKHAEASQIKISLTQKNNKLFVTYKDNGKGFDYEAMHNSPDRGMGLDNTISRINSIGGKCTIKSSKGNGFFAGIEVEIL